LGAPFGVRAEHTSIQLFPEPSSPLHRRAAGLLTGSQPEYAPGERASIALAAWPGPDVPSPLNVALDESPPPDVLISERPGAARGNSRSIRSADGAELLLAPGMDADASPSLSKLQRARTGSSPPSLRYLWVPSNLQD